MTGRAASGRERRDRERAKKVADRYFDLDTSGGAGEDGEEGDHLDDGYAVDPPRGARRRKPKPVPPSAPPRLTPKERLFIAEYLKDPNGTQAAIRAGYSEKTASVIAYENLRKPHIRALIEVGQRDQLEALGWDAQRLKKRIGEDLDADLGDIFDENGALKPIKDWPSVWRRGGVLAGLKIRVEYDEGVPVADIVEVKTVVRTKQMELMGRHVDVLAFKDRGLPPDPDGGPLNQLLKELQGTSIRPKVIEGTANEKPKPALPLGGGGLRPRED